MTEINTREIATALILEQVREVERLTIRERLGERDGYRDLPDETRHAMVDEIQDLIAKATVTIDWGDQPGRTSQVDQARDIARELLEANRGPVPRRLALRAELDRRIATDPALFWLRGEEKPPGVWTPPAKGDPK